MSDKVKEQFEKELDRKLLYSFWSKCEYETTIYMASWVGRSEPIKIDIYSQVKLNWNRFVDYCWSFTNQYKSEQEEIQKVILFAKHYQEENKYL